MGGSYSNVWPMITRFARDDAAFARFAACLLALLTLLLTLPLERSHQFANHLGAEQVRRSVERHTSYERTQADASNRVVPRDRLRNPFELVDVSRLREPRANLEFLPLVPVTLLLVRLKLGTARASAQDPLL